MKKLICTVFALCILSTTTLAMAYFDPMLNEISSGINNPCQVVHSQSLDYSNCLHLGDGCIVLSLSSNLQHTGTYNYVEIDTQGNSREIATQYEIYGVDDFSNFVIVGLGGNMTFTSEDTYHAGYEQREPVPVPSTVYGLMNREYEVILTPILNNTQWISEYPFSIGYNNYGVSTVYYKATRSHADIRGNITISGGEEVVLLSNGMLLDNYDQVYTHFVTENRYIVKGNGKSTLIDSQHNVITDDYAHIIELDHGIFHASKDPSETNINYDTVMDHNGNMITDFDADAKDVISDWAKPYVELAREAYLIDRDFYGFTLPWYRKMNYYTQNITRSEFCQLAMVLLDQKAVPIGEITDRNVFSDTKDEAILTAYELGMIKGVGDGKFDPYGHITREEAATILCNLAQIMGYELEGGDHTFSDMDEASDYAKESIVAISNLVSRNGEPVMNGTSTTTFDPQGLFTAEQTIKTMVLLYEIGPSYYQKAIDAARDTIAESPYTYEKVRYVLEDIDGDRQDELLMTYSDFGQFTVEVWTYLDGAPKLLIQQIVVGAAGAPNGGIGVISHEDVPYLYTYGSNFDGVWFGTVCFFEITKGSLTLAHKLTFDFGGADTWTPDLQIISAQLDEKPISQEELASILAQLKENRLLTIYESQLED